MKTYPVGTETKDMKFETWTAFQSALASKLYLHLDIARQGKNAELTGDLNMWKKFANAKTKEEFFKHLSHEILWMINEGVIRMEQAVAVGFDDSQLLID